MAIVQISKIQNRRGLQQDLPQLDSGEIGWSIDSRRIYIGNGTLSEGAPIEGRTEILTEFSIVNFTDTLTSNVAILQSNVVVLQGNITTLTNEIAILQAGTLNSNSVSLLSSSTGTIAGINGTNALINYTLVQGSNQRSGSIQMSRFGSTVSYEEDYTQTGSTDINFTMSANSSAASLNYTTTTATNLLYRVTVQQ